MNIFLIILLIVSVVVICVALDVLVNAIIVFEKGFNPYRTTKTEGKKKFYRDLAKKTR